MVRVTSTSPGPETATRAPMCTAIPATPPSRRVTSPACKPQRTARPCRRVISRKCHAQRTARARTIEYREQAVSRDIDELPTVGEECVLCGRLEVVARYAPPPVAELADALGRSSDVDDQNGRQDTVSFIHPTARACDELLDRSEQLGRRHQPMIGALQLDQSRLIDVLGEVLAMSDANVLLIARVDDQRRNRHERQHSTHVQLQNQPHLGHRDTRGSGEPLELAPELPQTRLVGHQDRSPPRAPVPHSVRIISSAASWILGGMPAG